MESAKRPAGAKLVIAVVALAILTFLGILSETSLNIAYSTLMREFAVSASVVQWLTTGYLLLLSVAIPVSPFMVRRFATKALFVVAVAIFTLGTLIGAFAVNFPMLLAARLVMALGTGISLPLITNIILEKAPLERRGTMLGIVSLVTCAAPAIGPVFGGLVMEWLNWHWIFYTMLPFLVISLVLGMATVPEIRHAGGSKGAGA
ncbi:multidrug resistance protein B [Bifidobacterium goeldii]|uniref:Multidrug resistance protein B n=1 Tax=Bifidobacterium goeldii TaxID=2306975 RepID=A0A430FFY3_9BIFI|nr:MFS transporter [Bifidobacterium goeldii]RSX51773.1 multidrug resistance protein B [Bifidobacterium goeldii]